MVGVDVCCQRSWDLGADLSINISFLPTFLDLFLKTQRCPFEIKYKLLEKHELFPLEKGGGSVSCPGLTGRQASQKK
jgi:hypothetical protein